MIKKDKKSHTTIYDLEDEEISFNLSEFSYQPDLTSKLDRLKGDFDQNIINEIVLWKVNRYAKLNSRSLELINKIDKNTSVLDEGFTRKILKELLSIKGIRLQMASTILKFKNPNVYQIIDQRAYRLLNEDKLKIPSNISDQIELYLHYIRKLKEQCKQKNIPFNKSDRVLYLLDKKINKDININS